MNQTGYSSAGPKCFGTSKRSTTQSQTQHPSQMSATMIFLALGPTIRVDQIATHPLNGSLGPVPSVTRSYRSTLGPTRRPSRTTPTQPPPLPPIHTTRSPNPNQKMLPAINRMKTAALTTTPTPISIKMPRPAMVSDMPRNGTMGAKCLPQILTMSVQA